MIGQALRDAIAQATAEFFSHGERTVPGQMSYAIADAVLVVVEERIASERARALGDAQAAIEDYVAKTAHIAPKPDAVLSQMEALAVVQRLAEEDS